LKDHPAIFSERKTMGTVHKTGCVLCPQNCGLEVEVENNRIVRVRGD
jgi:anaerobic selenocysteine-containing dehydrogenase